MYKGLDIAAGAVILLMTVLGIIAGRKNHGTLDKRYFQRRWNRVQKLCADKKLWYKAIIDADELLDEALIKANFKGKTTGERLVSAQHYFTANDAVWFSHKLKNKITEQGLKKLSKKQTMEAMSAIRLALFDLGAIKSIKKEKSGGK